MFVGRETKSQWSHICQYGSNEEFNGWNLSVTQSVSLSVSSLSLPLFNPEPVNFYINNFVSGYM